jgi:hypothetical protein
MSFEQLKLDGLGNYFSLSSKQHVCLGETIGIWVRPGSSKGYNEAAVILSHSPKIQNNLLKVEQLRPKMVFI